MIFEVTPEQIERLKGDELVRLLGRLLYAEAQLAGISQRGVTVPLQIDIPDGGEDARIEWEGGVDNTNYLPSRFNIFQAKATSLGEAGWKKEAWSKASQRNGKPKLSAALERTISRRGSYLGFTSTPMVGEKRDKCLQAIRDGIAEAGSSPETLAAIDIYDANKIAEWINSHPAVALWLNELSHGISLGGYQTVEGWKRTADFTAVVLVQDSAKRFEVRRSKKPESDDEAAETASGISSAQAGERLLDRLVKPGQLVRLFGPSGVGKTRFAFEFISGATTILKAAASVSAVYCDLRNVGSALFQHAQRFAEQKTPVLLIVDECSREDAKRLFEAATRESSQLRVLAIGLGNEPIVHERCLNIELRPSDDEMIEKIIRSRMPDGKASDVEFVRNLCAGFPRIAVLATDNYTKGSAVLNSIGDVVERILTGSGVTEPTDVRNLEVLALFDRLGADGDYSGELDFVAERLAGTTGDQMYESLARASEHLIVDRRSRFLAAQPIPIATFLGLRRLNLLRLTTLVKFIEDASPELRGRLLSAWQRFDVSPMAVKVAEHLLSFRGPFGTRESLETEDGAETVDALVHVAPDAAADAIFRAFHDAPIDDLRARKDGRRGLVRALEKLAFRRASFGRAARILLRLGAAENEKWDNNATGQFKQLYQLNLSGTEAPPSDRFAVLDEALGSSDSRIVSLALDAASETLDTGSASRSSGAEIIGSNPALEDWRPKIWQEVFDYRRGGLRRLLSVRKSHPEFAARCKAILASHIRGLLSPNLLDDVEAAINEILETDGLWLAAINSVGQWLYFDRARAPEDHALRVRKLYDRLLPSDPISLALLYTKFWSGDLYDPDLVHSPGDRDFEYSTRKAIEIAGLIAKDSTQTERVLAALTAEELHNSFPFARELALKTPNPVKTFRVALEQLQASGSRQGIQVIRGLLSGIDSRDPALANQCISEALETELLKTDAVNLFSAIEITTARLPDITKSLSDGLISVRDFVHLSYGRGLDAISPTDLAPVLSQLCAIGAEGMWTALEVVSMYLHGGGKGLDPIIEGFIKRITAAPELLGQMRNSARDGYLLEENFERIVKLGRLDELYAAAMADQVIRISQLDDYVLRDNIEQYARKIVATMVVHSPSAIWLPLARLYEVASRTEREALEELVGPDRHGFEGNGHLAAGVLFKINEDDLVTWAKGDPNERAPFLCSFFPVFEYSGEALLGWHPSMERLATDFGAKAEFRGALERRLEVRSWSGSLVPHLRAYLGPLEKWASHGIPELAQWASDMRRRLQSQIKHEQERDRERH